MPCNNNTLNLRSLFSDLKEFLITIKTFHIVIFHQPVTPVKLNRMVGATMHHFGAIKFGHGRLFGKWKIIIPQPASLVEEKAGTFYLNGHISQLEGVDLKIGYGSPELFPLTAVFEGQIETALGTAEPHTADGEPPTIQCLHHLVKSMAPCAQ